MLLFNWGESGVEWAGEISKRSGGRTWADGEWGEVGLLLWIMGGPGWDMRGGDKMG